jgi:hypothetical protein
VSERDAHFKSAKLSLQRLAEAMQKLTLQQQAPDAHGLRCGDARVSGRCTAGISRSAVHSAGESEGTVALLARIPVRAFNICAAPLGGQRHGRNAPEGVGNSSGAKAEARETRRAAS